MSIKEEQQCESESPFPENGDSIEQRPEWCKTVEAGRTWRKYSRVYNGGDDVDDLDDVSYDDETVVEYDHHELRCFIRSKDSPDTAAIYSDTAVNLEDVR
jgi:hypothetical protein